jgi:hypothetical protein
MPTTSIPLLDLHTPADNCDPHLRSSSQISQPGEYARQPRTRRQAVTDIARPFQWRRPLADVAQGAEAE